MKTSKKLLYSDLHLQLNDPLGRPTPDGLNTRIHRKLRSLEQVVQIAIENGCDEIVDLGDLFNNINPSSLVRNAYARVIKRAIESGIRVRRVVGNHETNGREADGADVGFLSDKYQVVCTPGLSDGILYVPEVDNETVLKYLSEFKDRLVIGHFEVGGVTYTSGMKTEEHSHIPSSVTTGRYLPIFLGHIHLRQVVGHAIYIGALCRHGFGDKDIPTGCCLLELQWNDEGRIVSDKYTFIDVPDSPMDQVYFEQSSGFSIQRFELLGNLRDPGYLKVIFEGTQEWFLECQKEMEGLFKDHSFQRVFVEFRPVATKIQVGQELDTNLTIDETIRQCAVQDDRDPAKGLGYLLKAREAAVDV